MEINNWWVGQLFIGIVQNMLLKSFFMLIVTCLQTLSFTVEYFCGSVGYNGICQDMYYVTLQVIHDSSFSNKLINHFQSLELIYQCSYLNWELSKSMHSSQEQKSTMTFEHDCHHHCTVEQNTNTPPPPVTIFFFWIQYSVYGLHFRYYSGQT